MKKIKNNFLGWSDNDFESPDHDKIMLWLDTNLDEILNKIEPKEWTEDEIKQSFITPYIKNEKELLVYVPQKPPLKVEKKFWEYPIEKDKIPIGFIDLYARIESPYLSIKRDEDTYIWDIRYLSGGRNISFEVKTKIKSIGEVIRQIKLYRIYIDTQFFLVSPDDRYAELLKSQNINFIKYEK